MKFYRGDVLRARLTAWLDVGRAALRVAAPVVDLLIRLFLAKAFFMPGMFPGSSVADFRSAWPIIIAQIMGPVLLAVGFWVRPVALLMLVLTLLAQASGAPQDEHLFWAALFGWYVVRGAGPLSLDHVLQKGLGRSALPLAGPAMAAGAWVNREIGPLYLLGLRLWLAAALAGPGLGHAMLPTMEARMLPRPLAVIGAALLALGLVTPVVAVGLLAVGSGLAMAGPGNGMTIYGPLLLILLAVAGGDFGGCLSQQGRPSRRMGGARCGVCRRDGYSSMIIVELLDARREPVQAARRTADQQYGCSAGGPRRRRRQHVVDREVAVRGERNPRQVRIALDEGRNVFTNECGENLEAGRRSPGGGHRERSPDGVAPGEHEASPVGLDAPVDHHLGLEIGNRPRQARRLDSANNVRSSRGRDGIYPDPAVEFDQQLVRDGRKRGERDGGEQQQRRDLHATSPDGLSVSANETLLLNPVLPHIPTERAPSGAAERVR